MIWIDLILPRFLTKLNGIDMKPNLCKTAALLRKLLCCIILLIPAIQTGFADSGILPEFQVFHSIGSRNSNYSTVAGGVAIQLSIKELGPSRWVHLLGLYGPEEIASARGNIVGWDLRSSGIGFEIGLYDQKSMFGNFEGAKIALRRLEWKEATLGNNRGKVAADILHLGWNFGTKLMLILGLNIARIDTPDDDLTEYQLVVGGRMDFK